MRRIAPFETPVSLDVERTEQPSTSAEMTATCFSVLNLFMFLVCFTALACQARSGGNERAIRQIDGNRLEYRESVDNPPYQLVLESKWQVQSKSPF